MMLKMFVGSKNKIKAQMKYLKMNQKKLAEQSGISRNTISSIVRGEKRALQQNTAEKLAGALNMRVSEIVEADIEDKTDKQHLITAITEALLDKMAVGDINALTINRYLSKHIDAAYIYGAYGAPDGGLDKLLWEVVDQALRDTNELFTIDPEAFDFDLKEFKEKRTTSEFSQWFQSLCERWLKGYYRLMVHDESEVSDEHTYPFILKLIYYLLERSARAPLRTSEVQNQTINQLRVFFKAEKFDYIFKRIGKLDEFDAFGRESIIIAFLLGPFVASQFWADTLLAPELKSWESIFTLIFKGIEPATPARVRELCEEMVQSEEAGLALEAAKVAASSLDVSELEQLTLHIEKLKASKQ